MLVPAARVGEAEAALAGLGFEQRRLARFDDRASRNCVWHRRSDGATVGLHTVVWGATAPVERHWKVITAGAETMTIAGSRVQVLGPGAKAVQVALHAAKHGSETPKPIEDLRRALERVAPKEWRAAAALARELGHESVLLGAPPPARRGKGRQLTWSGLDPSADPELILRNKRRSSGSVGFEVFFHQRRGVPAKVAYLADRLVPLPAAMRARYPLAGRGRPGLWSPICSTRSACCASSSWRSHRG